MPTIMTTYNGKMRFRAAIRDCRLDIDVAAGFGGTGPEPTPPELFAASIGSCVAAYVAGYCERHEIDTTGLAVEVDYANATGPARLDDFKVIVRLPNASVGPQRERILKEARRCLVHQTLTHPPSIEFALLDAPARPADHPRTVQEAR